MRFELQRLLLRDVSTAAVLDVAAVLRAVAEVAPYNDLWKASGPMSELASVSSSTRRRVIWLVGPNALASPLVKDRDLEQAYAELSKRLPNSMVIRSSEALAGILAGLNSTLGALTLATAGLDRHPYELDALRVVEDILDIETGRRWTDHEVVREHCVTRVHIAQLYATVGMLPDWPSPARPRGDLKRYRHDMATALTAGGRPEDVLPSTVRAQIQHAQPRIDALVKRMRGLDSEPDHFARQRLQQAMESGAGVSTPLTAYVVASVDFTDQGRQIAEVEVVLGGVTFNARGNAACRALLRRIRTEVPDRWFAPRALDLLAALADGGDALPERIVDPGLINYVFNTETTLQLDKYCPAARLLSHEQLAWTVDVRREISSTSTAGVGAILPALDRELNDLLVQERLFDLVEKDIAPTLPVLARIECRGARIGPPGGFLSWADFDAEVAAQLTALEELLRPTLGKLDPLGPLDPLVTCLTRLHPLTQDDAHVCRTPKDRLERLAARGFKPANYLIELRSIDSIAGYWRPLFHKGGVLSGRWVPQRTGRWGQVQPALTSLPKRGVVGRAIRGALLPPGGNVLIAADYNAFEGRLLAATSKDPLLGEACKAEDFHRYVAEHIFRRRDPEARGWAKDALYAMLYGQTERGFVRKHPELAPAHARKILRRLRRKLGVARQHQRTQRQEFRNNKERPIQTPGGWQRFAPTWRSAINTSIQAYAADVFRWVLRTLDRELRAHDSVIVHQMHDEVFVSTPGTCVRDTVATVKRVMEIDVLASGLLPPGAALVADVSIRSSWGKAR